MRVLVTAALLSLTTACGPLTLGNGTISAVGAPAAEDATRPDAPAADRATRPGETDAVSPVAPVVPVDPSAAVWPLPTASEVRSTPTQVTTTADVAAGRTVGSRAGSAKSTARGQASAQRHGSSGSSGSSRSSGSPAAVPSRSSGTSTAVPSRSSGSPTAVPSRSAGTSTAVPSRSAGTSTAAPAQPSGALTNTTASFSAAGYSADYRLFAQGIDTSRPVGLLVYADGTGEYGLEHPTSSYAIGGAGGLAAVARAHNMVLATPFSPNRSCKCWEEGDTTGYSNYLGALIARLQAQYGTQQLWFAGYSSGAQEATRFLFPAHPELWSGGGGVIAIGGGGAPAGKAAAFPASVTSNVVLRWNTGAQDTGADDGGYNALSGPWGAQAGLRWYADKGFDTAIVTPAGVNHDRSGQFGAIVESFLG